MKKVMLLLMLIFSPMLFAHSTDSSQSASGERYEICYLDGHYRMLQPNVCYALGGRRGG